MTLPALRLVSLAVADWRNVGQLRLETDARFVVFYGDNGQGKTNLLEAAYVLAALRSFREARPNRLVRQGAEQARIDGVVEVVGQDGRVGRHELDWRWGRSGRTLMLDGRAPGRLEDWFEVIRAVLFCPEHIAIVRGPPVERRRFIDRAVLNLCPPYLELARAYRRVVDQKAALLLGGRAERAQLDAWDAQLVDLGLKLARRRLEVVEALRGAFREMHRALAGHDRVDLVLRGVGAMALGESDSTAALARALAAARVEEIRRGRVLVGPHRDDLEIRLEGMPARHRASQGQARSLVLALKLAELETIQRTGEAPLFLLDDVAGELDRGRVDRLMELLGAMRCQVWLTTTALERLGSLPAEDLVRFRVTEGEAAPG